ncbi:hypothetical protein BC829DRAFT_430678 [Chytridium lagenaria]|nr:hypothetical protein BC829DRAFT_430678 [Chytridium lagenaria]
MAKKQDLLAVQSLRNWIMGPRSWQRSRPDTLSKDNPLSGFFTFVQDDLFGVKIFIIMAIYFFAFFCFTQSIRFYNHVGLVINTQLTIDHLESLDVRTQKAYRSITPKSVARMLERGSKHHTIGLRAYYASFMAIAWIWGPYFLLAMTIILVTMLRTLDMNVSQHFESDEHRRSLHFTHENEDVELGNGKPRDSWTKRVFKVRKEKKDDKGGSMGMVNVGGSSARLDPVGGDAGWVVSGGESTESLRHD